MYEVFIRSLTRGELFLSNHQALRLKWVKLKLSTVFTHFSLPSTVEGVQQPISYVLSFRFLVIWHTLSLVPIGLSKDSCSLVLRSTALWILVGKWHSWELKESERPATNVIDLALPEEYVQLKDYCWHEHKYQHTLLRSK